MLYPNHYSEKFSSSVISSDSNNIAKPSFLLDCFQVVAGKHSMQLGNSRQDLIDKLGCYWVLSRININIKRLPNSYEECKYITYPLAIKTPFCERDYIVLDSDGSTICEATSLWTVLDIKSHSIKNAKTIGLNSPEIHYAEKAMLTTNKIAIPDTIGMQKLHTVKIKASYIDENMHVNNSRYADFVIDAFEISEHREYFIKNLQINYLSQTLENDEITLYRNICDLNKATNGVFIVGINSSLNPSFSAYVELEKRR